LQAAHQSIPINPSINPSIRHQKPQSSFSSLLYTVVNKEVEQQFSGRGMTLKQEKPAFLLFSLNINNLEKQLCCILPLTLFCAWGHAKLSL
jgi:uncharacterized membrane protein SpoIIM required for sporulation